MSKTLSIPAAVDIEEVVLGALLIDEKGQMEAMPLLKSPDMFYKSEHKYIFEAIYELSYDNEKIDFLTVGQRLKKMNKIDAAGGDIFLINLTQKVSSSAHIEYHCRILQQYWLRRSLIKKCDEIRRKCFNDEEDVFDVLNEDANINDGLNEILFEGSKQISYAEALDRVEKRVEIISSLEEGEFTGVPTGFKKLDSFTGGWEPSDFIVVAARPGMGKTAFVMKNTVECGRKNVPIGFFSLEMATQQLAARTVSIDSDFHLSQLLRDGFDKDKYFASFSHHKDRMRKYPIFIDDTPSLDIRDLISKARIWKRKHDVQLIIVDYIQLVTDKTKSNREQEIASISRKLKGLAKELNIPVIGLAQLSRAVETRQDKHPKLSDLRESGAIEQDADIVAFLYREHYYNPDAELPFELTSIGANAEFNFAKYRSGSLETKGLYFDSNKVKYMDPEELNNTWNDNDLPKPEANEVPY